jgi:hypothetical protein
MRSQLLQAETRHYRNGIRFQLRRRADTQLPGDRFRHSRRPPGSSNPTR